MMDAVILWGVYDTVLDNLVQMDLHITRSRNKKVSTNSATKSRIRWGLGLELGSGYIINITTPFDMVVQ